MMRWPVDETGRNSVSPSTNPKIAASSKPSPGPSDSRMLHSPLLDESGRHHHRPPKVSQASRRSFEDASPMDDTSAATIDKTGLMNYTSSSWRIANSVACARQ